MVLAAALAVVPTTARPSSGAAGAQVVPTPSVEKTWAPAPCAHPMPDGEVQAVVWDEVARLHGLGLPACDLAWAFAPLPDGLWGYAYPYTDVDDQILVLIDPDPAVYGKHLEQDVRTTVRHEFGHALTYMAGLDDASLREMFDAELSGQLLDSDTDLGLEASAEAIAQALTPPGQARTWFYDERVDAHEVAAAERFLATYWP